MSRPMTFQLDDVHFLIKGNDEFTSMVLCDVHDGQHQAIVTAEGIFIGTTVIPPKDKLGAVIVLLTKQAHNISVSTVYGHGDTMETLTRLCPVEGLADNDVVIAEHHNNTLTLRCLGRKSPLATLTPFIPVIE